MAKCQELFEHDGHLDAIWCAQRIELDWVLTDGKLAGEDFDHVVTRLSDALRRQGRDGCIASLKQRLDEPQLRQIALILAADMAAADGVLHPEERAVVLAMARAFGVGEDAAREVLDGPPS